MKKYIFDLLYIASIIIALILLFTNASFPQSNVITKPAQVIKLTWTASTDNDVWQYGIFFCQGADTNLFPIKNNVEPDTLWKSEPISNWNYSTVYDNRFAYEPRLFPYVTYIRLGVSAINQAGKFGTIRCISKVIKVSKPSNVINVKIY